MAIYSAFKGINTAQDFEDAFKVKDITSPAMLGAIREWFDLYFEAEGDEDSDPSDRIPYTVVDGLHKAAFGEYQYSVDETSPKGKRIKAALDKLERQREKIFQQTLIGGEGFIKPIIKGDGFVFTFVNRLSYIVLARDEEGNVTSAGTTRRTVKGVTGGARYYTLLERRTVDDSGYLTIESRLYRSADDSAIGTPVPLTELPEYADILPVFTYREPIGNLGLIPVKTPMVNCVDGSNDGVSAYAAAAGKIRAQYAHERRTSNEYELTEPHAIVSTDLQKRGADGRTVELPKYITPIVDDDPEGAGITVYNPKPNQAELEARANQNMRGIENIAGLRRGTLSHVETDDKTATAVITSSSRYALTIKDFQAMWAETVPEVLRTCNVLANLYGLPDWGGEEIPEVALEWGNGVLYDEETDFNRLNLMVSQGNLKPEYVLGWMFDMPTETPKDLAAIREKYMPDDTGGEEGDAV